MSMAPLVVYLEEEIEKMGKNLKQAEIRMNANPPFRIIRRKINEGIYYYKNQWDKKKKKVISHFIGKEEDINLEELGKLQEKIKSEYEKRKDANNRRKKLLPLLGKILKLSKEAYEIEGGYFL